MNTSEIAECIIRLLPGAEIDQDHAASGSIYLTCFVGEARATARISDHSADDSPHHVKQLARTGKAADVEIDPDHETSAAIAAGVLADLLGLPVPPASKAARTRRVKKRERHEAARQMEIAARAQASAARAARAERAQSDLWAYVAALAACEAYRRSAALPNKSARKRARQLPARVSYAVGGLDQAAIFRA